MHIIAQDVCAFSDHKLVFWTCRMVEGVVRLQQGTAWHAGVELAIGIAGRRREDTVYRRPDGLIVSE